MKIYLVWYDNGEQWEDNLESVVAVFSSWDGAAKFLDDKGRKRESYKGYDYNLKNSVESVRWVANRNHVCCEGHDMCVYDCPRYEAWMDSEDSDEETYPCDDYLDMPDCYDHSSYYIEEREVMD